MICIYKCVCGNSFRRRDEFILVCVGCVNACIGAFVSACKRVYMHDYQFITADCLWMLYHLIIISYV